jgi:flagellar biogenesis protein FliO
MTTETLCISVNAFRLRMIELWERVLRLSHRRHRRLKLCESLPLGERRFVAVVEFDAARFLVGGTSSSLVLLSRLSDAGSQEKQEQEQDHQKDDSRRALWSRTSDGKRRGDAC